LVLLLKLLFESGQPIAAVDPAGSVGTAGVSDTAADAAPVPIEFFATTVQEYAVPLVSPLTATGLAAELPETVVLPAVQVAV